MNSRDAEIFMRGTTVLSFGLEAAAAVRRMGLSEPEQMRAMSCGLQEAVDSEYGGRAVLDLFSIALLRIVELQDQLAEAVDANH